MEERWLGEVERNQAKVDADLAPRRVRALPRNRLDSTMHPKAPIGGPKERLKTQQTILVIELRNGCG